METSPLVLWFDLMGVFFFALSGNLLAARKDIDITGGFILGLLAGLGGGIIRDVMLGVTPLALAKPVYLVPPLVAVVVVYLLGSVIHRVQTLIVACDAAGLGLFCTFGTARALDHGMPVASALLLGVVTAVGGGLMRDVVANEIPAVFSGSNLYVIPAATGAALTAVAVSTEVRGAGVGDRAVGAGVRLPDGRVGPTVARAGARAHLDRAGPGRVAAPGAVGVRPTARREGRRHPRR